MAAIATDKPVVAHATGRRRKLTSGPFCGLVPASGRRRSRLRTSTGLFCGRRREHASDAVVARYYNPTTGQFITRDPLEAQTSQPYEYAADDPIDNGDVTGLSCGSFSFSGIGDCLSDAGSGLKSGASDALGYVSNNSGALSTAASGLATVAYASCAFSDGIGCGVGTALSATSTALAGVNAEHDCLGGGIGGTSALTSLSLSAVGTAAGSLARAAAEARLARIPNAYSADVKRIQILAALGLGGNGSQFIYGLATRGCN